MDRARRLAARQEEPDERPFLPRLVGLGLALLVVVIVLFAFDRFLASMQRFLGLPVVAPEAVLTQPLPAYVVTPDEADTVAPTPPDAASTDAATPTEPKQ